MIANEGFQARVLKETGGLREFPGSDEPVRIGKDYVFVYPDFGTPDGFPQHTAHRFQVVTVMRRAPDTDDEMFDVRAVDGWTGTVDPVELFAFDPAKDLVLPAGLAIETDEDGPTQDGSVAIKRSLIDHFHANGFAAEDDMPPEFRTLARFFPSEYAEVCAEFEAGPARAFR